MSSRSKVILIALLIVFSVAMWALKDISITIATGSTCKHPNASWDETSAATCSSAAYGHTHCPDCGANWGYGYDGSSLSPSWGNWVSDGEGASGHHRNCTRCGGSASGHSETGSHDDGGGVNKSATTTSGHWFICGTCPEQKGVFEGHFKDGIADIADNDVDHELYCTTCETESSHPKSKVIEHHTFNQGEGIDEHKCTKCGHVPPTMPYHSFEGMICCNCEQCDAELSAEVTGGDPINALDTPAQYKVLDARTPWQEKRKPGGNMVVTFNYTPSTSFMDNEASDDYVGSNVLYLTAGGWNHHISSWHTGQTWLEDGTYDRLFREYADGHVVANAYVREEYDNNEEVYHVQDVEAAFNSVVNDVNWVDAVCRVGETETALCNKDDVNWNQEMGAWAEGYAASFLDITGEDNYDFPGSGRVFTLSLGRLPSGHGYISGFEHGIVPISFKVDGIRIYGPGHGSSSGKPPHTPSPKIGYLYYGYRDTNGNKIAGAPNDGRFLNVCCISGMDRNDAINFTVNYTQLNDLGWRYKGYIYYQKNYTSNLVYTAYTYDSDGQIIGEKPVTTDEKFEDYVPVGAPVVARWTNPTANNTTKVTNKVSGSVVPRMGSRYWTVIYIFEPVKVTVEHKAIAEGYTAIEPRLINTNLNTYYYLPFLTQKDENNQVHEYPIHPTGIHNHEKNGCVGEDGKATEGQILTHINKSLDKYLYPSYVLDKYIVTSSLGTLDTASYSMRTGGDYDVNTHTTEYDETENSIKVRKLVGLRTDVETEKWNKKYKDDEAQLGKIPDIHFEFDYSVLLIKINNILRVSSEVEGQIDNVNDHTKIPANLPGATPKGYFLQPRNSRTMDGTKSLFVTNTVHDYYRYPTLNGEIYKYNIYKQDARDKRVVLGTYGLNTLNEKGDKTVVIAPEAYGVINKELRGVYGYQFQLAREGQTYIDRYMVNHPEKYDNVDQLINKTMETKEVELTWYYYEAPVLEIEHRDISTGEEITRPKDPPGSPIIYDLADTSKPIEGEFIKDLKKFRYEYVHCTLDIDPATHVGTDLNIMEGSQDWDLSTKISVPYNGINRKLIIWYEKAGSLVDVEWYNIGKDNKVTTDNIENGVDVANFEKLDARQERSLKTSTSIMADVRNYEKKGFQYNGKTQDPSNSIGYALYVKENGQYKLYEVGKDEIVDINFEVERLKGKDLLLRFFYKKVKDLQYVNIEYRRMSDGNEIAAPNLNVPLEYEMDKEPKPPILKSAKSIQYYDQIGYILYNRQDAKEEEVTKRDFLQNLSNPEEVDRVKTCSIDYNGFDRLLVFWYQPKDGVPPEQLDIYGGQVYIDGEYDTEVILRSNDRGNEIYNVDRAIPTSEDLYGNVITNSYLLENPATSIKIEPDEFKVYFLLKYRDNANETDENYRLALKEVDLNFAYYYLSGINTVVKPLHHAIIKNEAIRSWSKQDESNLFNWLRSSLKSGETEGLSKVAQNGKEVDGEYWLYPNWEVSQFNLNYVKGGNLVVTKEKADDPVVTEILQKYSQHPENTTDLTVSNNSDSRIKALRPGVYNIRFNPDEGVHGKYSLVYVVDRDEVYANDTILGTATEQAVAALDSFYRQEVSGDIGQFLSKNDVKVKTDFLSITTPEGKEDVIYSGKYMDLSEDDKYIRSDYLEAEVLLYGPGFEKPSRISGDILYYNIDAYVDRDTENGNYKTYADIYFKEYMKIQTSVNDGSITTISGQDTQSGKTYEVAVKQGDILGTKGELDSNLQTLDNTPDQSFENQKGNDLNVHTPVVNDSVLIPGNFVNQKYKVEERDNFAYLQLDGTFTIEFPWEGTHIDADGYTTRLYNSMQSDNSALGNKRMGNDTRTWGGLKDVKVPFDTYLHFGTKKNLLIRAGHWVSDELLGYVGSAITMEEIVNFYTSTAKTNANLLAEDTTNKLTKYTFTIPVWVEEKEYTIETRVIAENAFEYVKDGKYVGHDSKGTDENNAAYKDLFIKFYGQTKNDDKVRNGSRLREEPRKNKDDNNYVATNSHTVEVIGKIYDLEVVKYTDPDWQSTQGGSEEEVGITSGRRGANTNKVNADAFPAGTRTGTLNEDGTRASQSQNTKSDYRYAPKLGYTFAFTFKTKGRKSNRIDINVAKDGFRFVKKIGPEQYSAPQVVDLYYKPSAGSKYMQIDGEHDKANLYVALNDQYMNADGTEKTNSNRIYPLEKIKPLVPEELVPYNYQNKVNIGKFSGLSLPHYLRLVYDNFAEYINSKDNLPGLYKRATREDVSKDAGLTKDTVRYLDSNEDYVIGSVGHWYAAYTLPISTIAMPRGIDPNVAGNEQYRLKGGYIIVTFDIKTQYDKNANNDGKNKEDYLIYTGPETNLEFTAEGDLPQEEILIQWNYVQGSSEEEVGVTGGRRNALAKPTNVSTSSTEMNPAYMTAISTNYNGEVAGDREQLETKDGSVAIHEDGKTKDRMYNTENNDDLLPVTDGSGKKMYYNKNVITAEERRDLEVLDEERHVTNAEALQKAGYYVKVYMPDGTYTYLPANSAGAYESDYTAQKDVGLGISN